MHQAILMHADIDKGTEGGDIGDDAVEGHPLLQVFHLHDIFTKTGGNEALAGVAARFLQLGDNIPQGRQADILADILLEADFIEKVRLGDQCRQGNAEIRRHLFYQGVSLRMDRGIVQGVFRLVNP